MNHVDADVALELASHEGLVRQTYKDSVGVKTWSIGVTSASGHDVDRYIGKPQPLEHCLAVYVWLLEQKYLPAVLRAFKGRTLAKHQLAAALSFHYNTGAIERASWVKKWLAGDVAGARKAFMAWNKPAEIVPRRQKERDLFFDGKWSNDGRVTEYTKVTAKMAPASPRAIDARKAMAVALGQDAAALAPPPVPAPVPEESTLAPAMTEYEVRALQQQLQDALYTEVGFVDGKLGTRTRAALFAFQTDNGLPATGEMNPETRAFIVANGVPTRKLDPARERATAESLAAEGRLPPAAQAAVKGGFWAQVQAAVAGIGALVYGVWESSGDALSALSPFKEDLVGAAPWLFFAAVGGVALLLYLRSRSTVDQAVRAVRLGRDTGA